MASTVTEGANPRDSATSDEKSDPWLVSFSPDDSDNPMVHYASWPVSTAFVMFNILLCFVELAPVETLVHHNDWRHPSLEFVCALHPSLGFPSAYLVYY